VIRSVIKRPAVVPVLDDAQMIDNAMTLVAELEAFIKRLRADAQRPSRIPADMQDLFDQQAARLDQAAVTVQAILVRKSAEFPVGRLTTDLREAAARLRREGINVYGSMLTARKPRESYPNTTWCKSSKTRADASAPGSARISSRSTGCSTRRAMTNRCGLRTFITTR
jgi:hypothetical protein